jgi:hypothetical protein
MNKNNFIERIYLLPFLSAGIFENHTESFLLLEIITDDNLRINFTQYNIIIQATVEFQFF